MDKIVDAPQLSAWAYLSPDHRDCVMVRGDNLQPGDTVYFRPDAYPCELFVKKADFLWSAIRHKPGNHFKKDAHLDPETWYVTRRAAPVALGIDRIRVDGDELAVGDIVQLGTAAKPYRAVILAIDPPDAAQRYRQATIDTGLEVVTFPFLRSGVMYFTVVGGPKITAANADPALVQQLPTGALWKGGD